MPLAYVFDEQLRGGGLWQAIHAHNVASVSAIDAVRVGDPADLPLGTKDPELLAWSERENRIILSRDKRTLPHALTKHLQAGRHVPGIFLLRGGSRLDDIVAMLTLIADDDNPLAWIDRMEYIP